MESPSLRGRRWKGVRGRGIHAKREKRARSARGGKPPKPLPTRYLCARARTRFSLFPYPATQARRVLVALICIDRLKIIEFWIGVRLRLLNLKLVTFRKPSLPPVDDQ